MNSPILITGAARSGTSLIASIIHNAAGRSGTSPIASIIYNAGAFGGNVCNENTPTDRARFENVEIRDGVVKPFLKKYGFDPKGQKPLPDISTINILSDDKNIIDNMKKKVINVISEQVCEKRKWYYKCAKICLMWPIWDKMFPDAKWIVVRRNTGDLVNSCLRTDFMNAIDTKKGWIEWVHEHERRFIEMREKCKNYMEVWPELFINRNNYSQILECVKWAGLEITKEKIESLVDNSLWRTELPIQK